MTPSELAKQIAELLEANGLEATILEDADHVVCVDVTDTEQLFVEVIG